MLRWLFDISDARAEEQLEKPQFSREWDDTDQLEGCSALHKCGFRYRHGHIQRRDTFHITVIFDLHHPSQAAGRKRWLAPLGLNCFGTAWALYKLILFLWLFRFLKDFMESLVLFTLA
ncbi:hypothetical protein GALMADRAFT_240223 [Galerina marginata CBS 339.88]|uniref:Uncharacterized protein n=1 Tax=Galerina marginata (strain CBS 339.88) TaxID=685588 RepID=A0A067TFD7_GALM3|nr:hypothetical protein GALMADRAFT_240223 [Galerina marginata CBS 339.88]